MDSLNLPNFYNHNVNLNQNEFLNLIQCGRDIGTPGFSYPHYNNFYLINIVKSGKGTLETQGKIYNLSPNDVFITYPNELSILTADNKNPWELCFFAFSGKACTEILQRTAFKDAVIITQLKDNSLSNDILDATHYMNNHSYNEFLTFEYLFKFLTSLNVTAPHTYIHNENREQKYVSEIKKYIQSNYMGSVKVNEIADKLNINRSHLYRIFKNEMDMGVEDYIVSIRINHAKVLLKTTEFSVANIASRVGYKNYTTFFKRFKQTVGITPLEYRQKQKENNNQ